MRDSSAAALPSFNPQRFINPASATHRVEVAISACLAGQRVRYDGADKAFAGTAMLEQALVLVPVCPEVGAGLSVPRPAVQLVSTATGPREADQDPLEDFPGGLAGEGGRQDPVRRRIPESGDVLV